MAPRSFRIEKDQKPQRARLFHYRVLTTSSSGPASPPLPPFSPIFLAPSTFNSFHPSLSPAPATAGDQHDAVTETAAIVGGGVASVVALAATATIASTIAGKFGVTCLLGSAGKILSFFFQTFMGSTSGAEQRNSKDGTGRRRWHRQDRRQRKSQVHGAGADEMKSEGRTLDWETLSGGNPTRAVSKEGSLVALAQEPDDKGSKRRRLMNDGNLVGTETAGASAVDKQEMRYTGGITTSIPIAYGTMISMPTKEKRIMSSNEMMIPTTNGKWAQHDVKPNLGKERRKRKQQSNLGHVHLSCDISAHYLHLFTSCKLGGVSGSPITSPNHNLNRSDNNLCHPKQNFHQDGNDIPVASLTRGKSISANYKSIVPMHNLSHNDSMHQQVYHPSKSIIIQQNIESATSFGTQHIVSLNTNPLEFDGIKESSHSPSKPSIIHDYGGPLDGFL